MVPSVCGGHVDLGNSIITGTWLSLSSTFQSKCFFRVYDFRLLHCTMYIVIHTGSLRALHVEYRLEVFLAFSHYGRIVVSACDPQLYLNACLQYECSRSILDTNTQSYWQKRVRFAHKGLKLIDLRCIIIVKLRKSGGLNNIKSYVERKRDKKHKVGIHIS